MSGDRTESITNVRLIQDIRLEKVSAGQRNEQNRTKNNAVRREEERSKEEKRKAKNREEKKRS